MHLPAAYLNIFACSRNRYFMLNGVLMLSMKTYSKNFKPRFYVQTRRSSPSEFVHKKFIALRLGFLILEFKTTAYKMAASSGSILIMFLTVCNMICFNLLFWKSQKTMLLYLNL